MAGNKTHEQQLRIIEKRVNTKNAGEEFDAEADLKRSAQERRVLRDDDNLRAEGVELSDPDDREMLRGTNQESEHHKRRVDD
jgi:hypothetical protein